MAESFTGAHELPDDHLVDAASSSPGHTPAISVPLPGSVRSDDETGASGGGGGAGRDSRRRRSRNRGGDRTSRSRSRSRTSRSRGRSKKAASTSREGGDDGGDGEREGEGEGGVAGAGAGGGGGGGDDGRRGEKKRGRRRRKEKKRKDGGRRRKRDRGKRRRGREGGGEGGEGMEGPAGESGNNGGGAGEGSGGGEEKGREEAGSEAAGSAIVANTNASASDDGDAQPGKVLLDGAEVLKLDTASGTGAEGSAVGGTATPAFDDDMDGEDVRHPHAVPNDDAKVEETKFAGAILHKKEQVVEEEEVYEGLEAGDEDLTWVPPSVYRAQRHREQRMFEGGKAPVWGTQLNELGVMGAGVPLYFKFLKYAAAAFSIMTILSAPIWFLSAVGSGLRDVDTIEDAVGLARLTIGNARTGGTNSSHSLTLLGGTITGKEVSFSLMVSDLCLSIFFIGFMFFLRHKVNRVVQETDANNVTSGDYTVMVQGLPDDATQDEVRRHFSELFQLSDPDWNFEGHLFGWFKKKESRPPQDLEDSGDVQGGEFIMPEDPVDPCRPIADVSNSQDAQYLGSWVAEVAMAYENGSSLRAYLNARELTHALRAARARVKKFALDTPHPAGANERKRLAALQDVDRIERRVEALKRTCTYNTSTVVAAYVIFNHEESYLRCLEDYEGSSSFWNRFWQPPPLRFRRLHGIYVQAAPEPSNVLWENLDTSWASRMARLGLTTFLSVLLLFASFSAILFAQTNKENFAAVIPSPDLCNIHLPAALYGQYLPPEHRDLTLVRDKTPGICENARHNFIRFDVNVSVPGVAYDTDLLKSFGLLNTTEGDPAEFHGLFNWREINATTNETVTPPSPCQNPCVAPQDSTVCEPVSCTEPDWERVDPALACPQKDIGNYSVQMLVNCFCLQEMDAYRAEHGWTSMFTMWFDRTAMCETFAREWGLAQVLPMIAPLAVVIINALLKVVLTKFARFERHHSTNAENAAIAFKVFVFQFINTALVTLMVFGRMPNGVTVPGQSTLNYFSGELDSFNTRWYVVVGSSITLTMFLNAFSIHAPMLAKKVEGELFEIHQKFPLILTSLFVTMFYCGGLPVLLPLAAFNFTLMFWIDKWLLLRFYVRPPYQDQALVVMAQNLLPYALILHLAITSWMFGDAEVMQSDTINMNQLVTLSVVLVMRIAGNLVTAVVMKTLRCMLCGYCLQPRVANPDRTYVPPYTEVYERELDPRYEHELLDQEVAQGWILNTDTEGRQWVAKQWLAEGVTDGIPHYQGQKKRTWEVIRDNGLETYEMTENEVYTDFAIAAKRAPANDGMDEEEEDDANKSAV